ncbi:MAG: hypothetical protein C0504_16375 [Candidatus Solibacter sp.]|nr:hypothetical protein [Candidatus Solibacter sp.]
MLEVHGQQLIQLISVFLSNTFQITADAIVARIYAHNLLDYSAHCSTSQLPGITKAAFLPAETKDVK